MSHSEGLQLFAELWHDRQYALAAGPSSTSAPQRRPARVYRPGMVITHVTFGRGVVLDVQSDAKGETVSIRFEDGTERKFLAGLVDDKLLFDEGMST